MKQYFAVTTRQQIHSILSGRYKNCLISYFFYKGACKSIIQENLHLFDNIVMDSGAFSSFNSGKEIDIDQYIEDLKESNIPKYFSLDAIGDAKKSFENFMYMKDKGMNPVPTFHINTDIEYLYKYLQESDYLSIGNMVQGNEIKGNLNKIWNVILTEKPDCKVHGLGVSNYEVAAHYPWDTIDSSSYCAITKFARLGIWNEYKKGFDTFETFDWLDKKLGCKIEERSSKGIDGLCFFLQQEQYNQMIDSINNYQKDKDFNYLKNQLSLF